MSYKTSPLLNRLKKIQGWKQSSFPIKPNTYTMDINLGFKIYLLLKAYLTLNNFKLLLCQLRSNEKNIKIVYIMLVHSMLKQKKKKILSQQIFSTNFQPLSKPKTKLAVYLLYKDLIYLKKLVPHHHRINQNHLPSILWWKTLTTSIWIHLFLKKFQKRKYNKKNNWEIQKKKKLYIKHTNFIKQCHFETVSQRKTLSKLQTNLLYKIRKNEYVLFTLQKALKFVNSYSILNNHFSFKNYLNYLRFLKKKLWLRYIHIKKTISILLFLKTQTIFLKQQKIFSSQQNFKQQKQTYITWIKIKSKKTNYLNKLKQQLLYYQYFYTQNINNKTLLTLFTQSNTYTKTHPYNIEITLNKTYFSLIFQILFTFYKLLTIKSQTKQNKNFFQSQINKNYLVLLKQFTFFLKKNNICLDIKHIKGNKILFTYKFRKYLPTRKKKNLLHK